MFRLMGKKIITILCSKIMLNWSYDNQYDIVLISQYKHICCGYSLKETTPITIIIKTFPMTQQILHGEIKKMVDKSYAVLTHCLVENVC